MACDSVEGFVKIKWSMHYRCSCCAVRWTSIHSKHITQRSSAVNSDDDADDMGDCQCLLRLQRPMFRVSSDGADSAAAAAAATAATGDAAAAAADATA